MTELLWQLASKLHDVKVCDRTSLDIIVGVEAHLIALATSIESKQNEKEMVEHGRSKDK